MPDKLTYRATMSLCYYSGISHVLWAEAAPPPVLLFKIPRSLNRFGTLCRRVTKEARGAKGVSWNMKFKLNIQLEIDPRVLNLIMGSMTVIVKVISAWSLSN
jgi:hypothetical protein